MTCPSCGRENPDGFGFCGFCGAALSQAPATTEERKVVTVLFCDLVGFTARSDRADPEDVKARLRPFHTALKREVEAFGGTLDKFIGDAALGVFGSPVAHEDDPERAIRAALAIQGAIAALNEAHPDLGLAIRQGINTGEAVVAFGPGSGPLIGEAVTGDVVNTASRLESVAPVGGIVVGEQTYRATGEAFVYQVLDPVTVKGKAEPLPIWRVVAARSRAGVEDTRPHAAPFVGRDEEFAALRAIFERAARSRQVEMVTLIGEAGVGKSRLVAELARFVDDLPELVTWRRGRCLPYGEGITFWALGEIVSAHAGILESDPPEEALAKLDAVIPEDDPDREWLRNRLAPLVGAEAASAAERVERDEAFAAWRRFLESLARALPAVLVFEDIHWADPAMLDFLRYLVETVTGVPMLLLCTARFDLRERAPDWESLPGAAAMPLSPLSPEDTSRLISGLLDEAALPTDVQTLLLERAGGNPLYAEEFVLMLMDQGALVRSGGSWQLVEGADVRFPDSIQALVAARLDTLAPGLKALLQDASVVGRTFWAGALGAMGRRDPAGVTAALDELAGRELVRPVLMSSIEGQAEYTFWHVVHSDVCYSQIPRAARAAKHREAARWLEDVAGERVENLAEVLVHHTTTALELARASGNRAEATELEEPAIRYLELAGDRALGLDVARAESNYDRALALALPGHIRRPYLLARWADAVRQAGRFPDSAEALEVAIRDFTASGDRLAAARAMGTLSSVYLAMGDARQEEVAAEAVRLLESDPPGPDLVSAYVRMAGVELVIGSPPDTIAWVDRATALAGELGVEVPARAVGFRGYARCSLGDAAGLGEMRAALTRAVNAGEGRDAAVLYNNLAVAVWPIEGREGVLSILREGIEFSERHGIAEFAVALSAASLSQLEEAGEWDRALELAESIERDAEATGDVADLLQVRWVQTRILAARGEVARAAGFALWLEAAARASGGVEDISAGFTAAAVAHLAAGDPARAVALLAEIDRTPHIRESPSYPPYLGDMVRVAVAAGDRELAERLARGVEPVYPYHEHALAGARAILLEASGDLHRAAEAYRDAAARWERFGVVPERAHALWGQGRCLLEMGRSSEAAEPLREARACFANLGAEPAVAVVEELLERLSSLSA